MIPALFRRRRQEQMQRSVGARGAARMCQRAECPALCSQLSQTPSKSALCSFWGCLRNLHLCYSQNRHGISMGKELGRAVRGGLFSRAVFQPLLKTWRFSGTDCESVYNLLPFSGLFFGVRAKGVKKITEWLHLDEPHSN